MYKKGLSKLSPRERRSDRSDYWTKIRMGTRRYREVRLCSDKELSARWEKQIQAAADRQRAGESPDRDVLAGIPSRCLASIGLIDPLNKSRHRPWDSQVLDYCDELVLKGRSKTYIANVDRCLRDVRNACGWKTLANLERDSFIQFLQERRAEGRSPRTLNNIRSTLVSFLNWAVRSRRLERHEFNTVERIDERSDRRRIRRALRYDETVTLLSIAGKRELCYRLALCSGLRRSELKQLEWRDVNIENDHRHRPHLQLRAEATKSRRADIVPLPINVAQRLRNARPETYSLADRVLATVPTFETWRNDLKRAGLNYRDEQNRVLGFHSLRVTVSTNLRKTGRPQTEIDAIMRHRRSDVGSQSYTDISQFDLHAAVESLPRYELDKELGSVDHRIRHQQCGATSPGLSNCDEFDRSAEDRSPPSKSIEGLDMTRLVALSRMPGTGVEPALRLTGTRPST